MVYCVFLIEKARRQPNRRRAMKSNNIICLVSTLTGRPAASRQEYYNGRNFFSFQTTKMMTTINDKIPTPIKAFCIFDSGFSTYCVTG